MCVLVLYAYKTILLYIHLTSLKVQDNLSKPAPERQNHSVF